MLLTTRDATDETLNLFYRSESEAPVRTTLSPSHAIAAETEDVREGVEGIDQSHLDRVRLIQEIIRLNPTASESYLGEFQNEALARYLAHLETIGSPRGARWERPGDSPAIVVRETSF